VRPACTVPHTVPVSFREAHVGRCPGVLTAPPGAALALRASASVRCGAGVQGCSEVLGRPIIRRERDGTSE